MSRHFEPLCGSPRSQAYSNPNEIIGSPTLCKKVLTIRIFEIEFGRIGGAKRWHPRGEVSLALITYRRGSARVLLCLGEANARFSYLPERQTQALIIFIATSSPFGVAEQMGNSNPKFRLSEAPPTHPKKGPSESESA
jgi:hypothetical protein